MSGLGYEYPHDPSGFCAESGHFVVAIIRWVVVVGRVVVVVLLVVVVGRVVVVVLLVVVVVGLVVVRVVVVGGRYS